MPTPNFQVIAKHTDKHHRQWVRLRHIGPDRAEISVPTFACLHLEERTSWDIAPGAHVFIHPETVRFYTVQEVPNGTRPG